LNGNVHKTNQQARRKLQTQPSAHLTAVAGIDDPGSFASRRVRQSLAGLELNTETGITDAGYNARPRSSIACATI